MIEEFRAVVTTMLDAPDVEVKKKETRDGEVYYSVFIPNRRFKTHYTSLFQSDVTVEIFEHAVNLEYNNEDVSYETTSQPYLGMKQQLVNSANRYAAEVMKRFITDMTEYVAPVTPDAIGMNLQN